MKKFTFFVFVLLIKIYCYFYPTYAIYFALHPISRLKYIRAEVHLINHLGMKI